MNELAIILKPNDKQCLYMQIYDYIVKEIRTGKLLAGEKLPSTRFLAQYLQISRSTVEFAYEQLLAEGYIESIPCKGYFVSKIEYLIQSEIKVDVKKQKVVVDSTNTMLYDFSPTRIQKEGFPFSVWKKLQKEALAENENQLFALGNPQGEEELRSTIARYLHASRGVECSPNQIIVGAGNDYLMMLLEKILGKNHVVAIENPTYSRAYQIFQSFSYEVCAVEMDHCGMRSDLLYKTNADLVYIMPAHQFPTGIVMPISRRMELLSWANAETKRYIIEDDYDSEFRYRGRPMKSFQSLDENGKVIYMGTFSKTIAPAIRISYMVLPLDLLKQYKISAQFFSSTVSRIDQATIALFLRDGYFERHLNKMRKRYKEKHDMMLECLKSYEHLVDVSGDYIGLHFVVTYKGKKCEEELMIEARRVGVQIYPMSQYWLGTENKPRMEKQFLLGYASLELDEIKMGIKALMSVWEQ